MEIPDNHIPDNNIVIFRHEEVWESDETVKEIISRPPKTRDWFKPNFYRCVPLLLGNSYGFTIKNQVDFSAIWDGTERPDGVTINYFEPFESAKAKPTKVVSIFGSGILTIGMPFHLKTPKGVNLITINPTNYVIPNITVMSGVIETDNLQRDFTLNLKIQEPYKVVHFKKGDPLTTILPIPRYFQDNYVLKLEDEIFEEKDILNEVQTAYDSVFVRVFFEHDGSDSRRFYRRGVNVYEQEFPDHQTSINYEA